MKLLIIRFSSIGDIVLTTPLLRCLKEQRPEVEIHYLTKKSFVPLLSENPYVHTVHAFDDRVNEILPELKQHHFDEVIDLHHNIRSLKVKRSLGVKHFSFEKLNIEKWLLVNFKINRLPKVHIVDRYFKTIEHLGVKNDGKGLDYFLSDKDKVDINALSPLLANGFHCLVAGGSYYTKQIPFQKMAEIVQKSDLPIVVCGGKADAAIAGRLSVEFPGKVVNACGRFSINQSASIIQQAKKVITSDTGLMHIASAFKKQIFSLWGNTIPEFGMYPYLPGDDSKILEVKNLPCRPCSKLGHAKCPKRHFKCMMDIKVGEIFNS